MSETGALSIEDAVAHLSVEEAVDDQPQTPETDAGDDVDDPDLTPDAGHQETDDGEGDEPGEGEDPDPEEADDPEFPAIEPPKSWDAEHREKFAALPRDVQEYLLARETERDKGVSVQQQRAVEARQAAEREAQAVAALRPQIETLMGQAQKVFQQSWQGMDATAWAQLAQTDPNRYVALKAQHDADVHAIQQLDAARRESEAVEWQAFAQAQTARLPEVAPQIAADQKVMSEVFDYIAKSTPNLTPEDRKWIDADQMLIAWKAMQYDQAKAPQPKPQGKKVITAKPSTAPAPLKQRQSAQVVDRFRKTGSIDDAVALLNQRG